MNKAQLKLTELVKKIVAWINRENIPCFYAGIRADCAFALRVAPNSPLFTAAFNLIEISPADYGRDYIVAYIPWGM